jgi:membrane protein DedA with SNARE-associated domain
MKELIRQYGAWIVFALVFLELIGLPLPGEAILVSAAIFAGTTQELGIGLVLLSAVLGATLGSTIGFWIGDRYGYPLLLRYGSYIGLTPKQGLRSPSICFGVRERWLSSLLALLLCCDRSSGSLREQTGCPSPTS